MSLKVKVTIFKVMYIKKNMIVGISQYIIYKHLTIYIGGLIIGGSGGGGRLSYHGVQLLP